MRFRFAVLLLPAALAASIVGACSNQGEGGVCDVRASNNGNDDCQSGLVCTPITGVNGARCCPQDRSTATTVECSISPGVGDASSALPDSATPTPEAGPDVAAEAAAPEAAADTGASASDATGQ
jgi:hypothetical protein